MARVAGAWWPGGRTAQKALANEPSMTASIAWVTAPTARIAASQEPGEAIVSGSSDVGPSRQACSMRPMYGVG